jgi:hypothetical protein
VKPTPPLVFVESLKLKDVDSPVVPVNMFVYIMVQGKNLPPEGVLLPQENILKKYSLLKLWLLIMRNLSKTLIWGVYEMT